MGLALLFIVVKGTSSDGHISFFDSIFTSYIEETSASATVILSSNQLTDMNSAFAYSVGLNRVAKPSILNMIQDNSVVSRGTILTDIIDEFSDRGSEVTSYEVREGDTISFIASDFGIKINTIIWANNLKSADDIRPGMVLKIPPIDGIVHKIVKGDTVESLASKYSANSEKIINYNGLPQDGSLTVGIDIIIPDGKIKSTVGSANSSQTTVKRFSYLPNLGGYFAPPATGYNWGRIHGRNAVDIANSCGTPLYASANGKVTLARGGSGWNGGFGRYVQILHPNGTETLYAHMTKVLVSAGENVLKNQQIGVMGKSGNSTGCHLHFEVHGAKNPLAK